MKKIFIIILVLFFISLKAQEVSAFRIRLPFIPFPTIPKPTIIFPTKIPRPIWRPFKPTTTPTLTPTSTPTPTVTPTPANQIILASNLPANIANSEKVWIPWGYKSMTIDVTSSEVINFWSLQVSFDNGQSWHEQHKFTCVNTTCPEVTVPILRSSNYNSEVGATYRIFAHSNSNNALVNASAILNEEPTARVVLIDWDIRYGYISQDLSINGFSTITITASGGYTPNNLEGISLQKWVNDSLQVLYYLSCSNGMCPLETLQITDGLYRIVLHGENGTGATLGFILRK